jgi:hypothetical protein
VSKIRNKEMVNKDVKRNKKHREHERKEKGKSKKE